MRPENTLAAFRYAMEIGCDGVELDIHCSRDGVPVVIHEDTVPLSDGRRRRVSEMTTAELTATHVGEGQTIPTLESVLRLLEPSELYAQIELKGAGAESAALQVVSGLRMEQRVVFTSFVHERVLRAKQLLPRIRTGVLLASVPLRLLDVVHWAYADNIHLEHRRITPAIVTEVHSAGKVLAAWGRIRATDEIDRLIRVGVDVIGSDWPAEVLDRRRVTASNGVLTER